MQATEATQIEATETQTKAPKKSKKESILHVLAKARTKEFPTYGIEPTYAIPRPKVATALGLFDQWMADTHFRNRHKFISDLFNALKKENPKLDLPINEVFTRDWIQRWINEPGLKLNTLTLRRSQAKKLNHFVILNGWMQLNLVGMCKILYKEIPWELKQIEHHLPWTDEEIETVLKMAAPGSFWYTAIHLARYAGLRLNDCRHIEWGSFTQEGRIVVYTIKRNRRVELPIHPKLREALRHVAKTDERYLYPRCIKRPNDRTTQLFSNFFIDLRKKAGVHGRTFHGLRTTFINNVHDMGLTLEQIGILVGHKDTGTTRAYVTADRLKVLYDRNEQSHNTTGSTEAGENPQ